MTDIPTQAAPRRNWLRRNLVALIVLVLAIPGLVFVVYVFPTLEKQGETQVTTVAQGKSITAAGYRFTLTKSQEFVGTGSGAGGNDIPIGTSLVGTIVLVTPLGGAKTDGTCQIDLTERTGGKELTWQQVSDLDKFNYDIGEDRTEYCILDGTSIEVETVFLTPTGTYKHATVDVSGMTGPLTPEVYRFALVH